MKTHAAEKPARVAHDTGNTKLQPSDKGLPMPQEPNNQTADHNPKFQVTCF